jgi:hypothetical protein
MEQKLNTELKKKYLLKSLKQKFQSEIRYDMMQVQSIVNDVKTIYLRINNNIKETEDHMN